MQRADIQFQDRAVSLLSSALSHERLPHAYVFHGPDGVGKESLARLLAATIMCEKPHGGAFTGGCGECKHCTMIAAGSHPDLHVIDRSLSKFSSDPSVRNRRSTDLGVDVIRENVIARVTSQPFCAAAQFFIIRDADQMTVAAQNALLKTLEEPPGHTVLVLLSIVPERLTMTTRSRCQLIPFGPLPAAFIEQRLAELDSPPSPPAAAFLSRYAGGQLGLATDAATINLHEHKQSVVAALTAVARTGPAPLAKAIMDAGKAMTSDVRSIRGDLSDAESLRESLRFIFGTLAFAVDDAMRLAVGDAIAVNVEQEKDIQQLAERLDAAAACDGIRRLAEAQAHLDANANAQLAVDVLAADLTALMTKSTVARPQAARTGV